MGRYNDERGAGLIKDDKKPIDSSVSTFIGFNMVGVIPLIPFVIFLIFDFNVASNVFFYSILSVIAAFLLVGMIKGKIVKKSMIQSGISTIIIGGVAATAAYVIGYGLHFLVE